VTCSAEEKSWAKKEELAIESKIISTERGEVCMWGCSYGQKPKHSRRSAKNQKNCLAKPIDPASSLREPGGRLTP